VDYLQVGDSDDPDNGSVINRLELACRRDNDAESPIMTVVGSGTTQHIVRRFQFGICGKVTRAPLAVYLFLLSAGLLIVTVALERVYVTKKTSKSVNNFLVIAKSVGIFSFVGQLSHLIAWKFSFFSSSMVCCKRSRYKVEQDVTQCLKRFITCTIFEEVAVRNYIQRCNVVNEETKLRNILDFVDSSDLEDIVADQLSHVYDSAEGPLLETMDVDRSQLHVRCCQILQQAVCRVLKKLTKESSLEDWRRPETIRNHVVELANLQLQCLNWKDISKFLKSISRRQSDNQALSIFICMTLAGCIIEVLRLFFALH